MTEEINDQEFTMPKENAKSSAEKFFKIISIFIGFVLIAILIVIKYNVPDFPLLWVFLISAIIIVLILVIFFFSNIKDWIKKKKDVKEAMEYKIILPKITVEQAREIAQKSVINPSYAEMIPECCGEQIHTSGKNLKSTIYEYKSNGMYSQDKYHVLINMQYPQLNATLINPSPSDLRNTIHSLAVNPEDEPDTEETTVENPLTGVKSTTKKTSRKKGTKQIPNKEADL